MPVPQGGWRLGLHGPGAISHRGIPIPKGDGVLALWPRPHPPLGNTPKGGGVLAFMASSSSPTGGNPSPRGMGSWPYGLDPVLHRGTPPRGVASWPSWPWRHLPSGEIPPHWGWGLGPMASASSSLGEQSPKGGGVLAFMASVSSPIGGNGVWRVACGVTCGAFIIYFIFI